MNKSARCFWTSNTTPHSLPRWRPTNTSCHCMRAWWRRSSRHRWCFVTTTKMMLLVFITPCAYMQNLTVYLMNNSSGAQILKLRSSWWIWCGLVMYSSDRNGCPGTRFNICYPGTPWIPGWHSIPIWIFLIVKWANVRCLFIVYVCLK